MSVEMGSRHGIYGAQSRGAEVLPGVYTLKDSSVRHLGGSGVMGAFAPDFNSSWGAPRVVTSADFTGRNSEAVTAGAVNP